MDRPVSRVVVIGATGYIGTYLVPLLVAGGYEVTREHTVRSITASIALAREVLRYAPRYTALGALREALTWLADNGQADIGGRPFAGMSDLTVAGTTVKPNICGRPQGR